MNARRIPRSYWLRLALQAMCLVGFLALDVIDQFRHAVDWLMTAPLVVVALVCAFYNARTLRQLRSRS